MDAAVVPSTSEVATIRNASKRILFIGTRGAGILDVVRDLTGSSPSPVDASGSIAGLSHEWRATTPYYSALVPVWIDEFPSSSTSDGATAGVLDWQMEFLRDEACDVVRAVGAWVYVFPKPSPAVGTSAPTTETIITDETRAVMKAIQDVVEKHAEYDEDGISGVVKLAIAKGTGKQDPAKSHTTARTDNDMNHDVIALDHEAEEEMCQEFGFEFVDYSATGHNAFGEKVGFARLQEALQTIEWTSSDPENEHEAGEEDEDDITAMLKAFDGESSGMSGTDREEAEWTAEMFAVKAALLQQSELDDETDVAGENDDNAAREGQVDDLDRLMGRLLAVKEQSVGLPEEERKRLAARAVREVVRDL